MKQPIALLITDTHLHDGNIDLVTNIFDQAISMCKRNEINTIYHLGDWFTSRKAQSEDVLLATDEIIEKFRDNGIYCKIIKGNHDATQADSTRSFINIFNCDNFEVIQNEYHISIHGHLGIDFIPYFKETGSYLSRLENLCNKKFGEGYKRILLTHIAVTGVRNNDGTVVENCLSSELFKTFHSVFVGHYHNQSKIGNNIYYIGSAYQDNFGENNKKGFTILYDDGSHQFIKSQFKEYVKVKLDILDSEAIKQAQEKYKNSSENVRFVFLGDEAELKHVSKEKFASLGIDVDFEKDSAVPLNADDLVEKTNHLSFDRNNILKGFDTFCQTKHIEDNSIGKSYLEKI